MHKFRPGNFGPFFSQKIFEHKSRLALPFSSAAAAKQARFNPFHFSLEIEKHLCACQANLSAGDTMKEAHGGEREKERENEICSHLGLMTG